MANRDTDRDTGYCRVTEDGLLDCSCEGEALPPDYEKWLDDQEMSIEEKDKMAEELESQQPVF